jgi:hypothetical protein
MANIQTQMIQFHEKIKLKRFEQNETLREKRDIILRQLDSGLKKNFAAKKQEPPEYRPFDQGSYAMGTGTMPLNADFDIDLGISFIIAKDDYDDPVEVKQWVYDALQDQTTKVEIRHPCVTVYYMKDGEPIYHVDLAVYSDGGSNSDGKMYLAKGKLNSASEYRVWEEAEPEKLIELIKDRFANSDDDKQFRRVIRYLKRWKDNKFSSNGNAAPIGIGITVAAYHWFLTKSYTDAFTSKRTYDDLDALGCFVHQMLTRFESKYIDSAWHERLEVILPVAPGCDLFEKMTNPQMVDFKAKLLILYSAIKESQETADPVKACEVLRKQFGDDFPVPSRSETGQKRSPAIISCGSSA